MENENGKVDQKVSDPRNKEKTCRRYKPKQFKLYEMGSKIFW